MKRLLPLLLMFLALFMVHAEGETVSYKGLVTADSNAIYVDFGSVQVDDLSALESFLDRLPNLMKCDMFETVMKPEWADELYRRYFNIEFGWTFHIECSNKPTHVIRTDMTVFSTLHNNQSRAHSAEDFAVLKYCPHLIALDIGHNGVNDISFVKYMPHLRVLIIGRNAITSIAPLAACPELEYLEAFSNRIDSVAPLLGCKNLLDLNVPNNRIEDPELFAHLTSLKRLWAFNYAWGSLQENHVPQEIRSMVRNALPDCEINWIQMGTGGTWRTVDGSENGKKTPHYAVINEMFTTGVYIPFAESAPLN